jgi:2-keto-myo-inositol isomerase
MLLGFNGATTMKADLNGDITAAHQAGFKALELWAAKVDDYLHKHELAELKSLLRKNALLPASINSLEFITFRTAADYERIQARCRQLCEWAQAIGCDRLVVVPSPTPKEGATRAQIRTESVRVLRELAAIAAPFGVRLAFEFLGFGWCSVRTLAQCWEIVEATGRPNVGLVIDTCHFYAGGSRLDSIDKVPADRIFIFHINDVEKRAKGTVEDAHRLLPGEGVIPLDAILKRLKATGFDGLCSIELFRPAYWERPPAELAAAARAATQRVLAPYFNVE